MPAPITRAPTSHWNKQNFFSPQHSKLGSDLSLAIRWKLAEHQQLIDFILRSGHKATDTAVFGTLESFLIARNSWMSSACAGADWSLANKLSIWKSVSTFFPPDSSEISSKQRSRVHDLTMKTSSDLVITISRRKNQQSLWGLQMSLMILIRKANMLKILEIEWERGEIWPFSLKILRSIFVLKLKFKALYLSLRFKFWSKFESLKFFLQILGSISVSKASVPTFFASFTSILIRTIQISTASINFNLVIELYGFRHCLKETSDVLD